MKLNQLRFQTLMDKKLPVVSIITIVYNGVRHIEDTIKSVITQTYPNIEYIIIDGNSTDGTQEVIKRYEHKIARWISEKDRGISDAFNKGIAMASGALIGMINADDWYEPDAIASVVAITRITIKSFVGMSSCITMM